MLNLSDGGLLAATSDLGVGGTIDFELVGPDFRFAGLAKVAHRTDVASALGMNSEFAAEAVTKGASAAGSPGQR